MYITILAAWLFAYYFVKVAMLPNKIKELYNIPFSKRIKPLDCVTCLSVWSAAILYFIPIEVSQFLCITFGAGFIGQIIK
jgi:hypothetical protein